MKKIVFYLLILVLIICPFNTFAISQDYEDVVSNIVGVEPVDDVVNIYFFYGDGCPHCASEEKVLNMLESEYGDSIKIYRYETWYSSENASLMKEVKDYFEFSGSSSSVPYTIIGTKTYSGYSDYVGTSLETLIRSYLELEEIEEEETVVEENKVSIPLLGEVNASDTAVGVAAVILGFVDGFNPCAMWVLLFIIDMLFGMKDKKKMFILGYTFLFTSALFYFLAMLGINVIIGTITTSKLQALIGIVGIVFGLYNLYEWWKSRKDENGCHVVDEKKRKSIIKKVTNIKNARNFFIAFIGIVFLAISVNMVELACSAGYPTIFSEIMVANGVTGISRILYLLLYVLFYMLDDLVVFTVSVCTLSLVGMTTKYNKLVKLIGGILMIVMGLLLIFKPEWIMFNF